MTRRLTWSLLAVIAGAGTYAGTLLATRCWSTAALFAVVALADCGGVNPQEAVPPEGSLALSDEQEGQEAFTTLVPETIFPDGTGAEIDWKPPDNSNAQHLVWLPAGRRENGKLFLFIPGTGGKPTDYQYLSSEAARAGYHVIGLMYRNERAIETTCPGSPDENCSGNMRLEILTGIDISNNVTVNVPNSIDYRLTRLIVYLDGKHPDQGWSRFLRHGQPNWSRIAVGGASQGAGQSALIAQLRRVPRVVMLSGPPDSRLPNQDPPVVDSWVHIGRTPASKHFALYHHRDRSVVGPPTGTTGILTNLHALGLDRFGAPVAVGTEGPYCTDDLGSPSDSFGDTHLLVTDLFPRGDGGCGGVGPGNPHRSTARDAFTPLAADGTPKLVGAWRYLLSGSREEHEQEELVQDE